MMAEPAIPAAEFMDNTRTLRDEDPVANVGPNYYCPQCDRELEDGPIAPTWRCRFASCPSPSVVEGARGGRR